MPERIREVYHHGWHCHFKIILATKFCSILRVVLKIKPQNNLTNQQFGRYVHLE